MDSQRDLSRSLLKARLLEQAAATGGPEIGIVEHLARPITNAEVQAYNHALGPNHAQVGAVHLARTLEGALQPMMVDVPVVKHVVSTVVISTPGWMSTPYRADYCVHGTSHPNVHAQPVVN